MSENNDKSLTVIINLFLRGINLVDENLALLIGWRV
jgi:hypothetical protein